MAITCLIRDHTDPIQRDAVAACADTRSHVSPRCGGALIGFEGAANFERARHERFIVREQRSWLEDVPSTRRAAA